MSVQSERAGRWTACPLCDPPLDRHEYAGQFHHPHWNSMTLLPGLTVEESMIAQKIERAARAIAAEKINSSDPRGYRLPDDIWKQGIKYALAMLKLETLDERGRETILRAAAALLPPPPVSP